MSVATKIILVAALANDKSTLLEKVTVWVKWGGAGCHQKVHWWRQRYVTMRTKGVSGMGCFLKTQARKIPVSIKEYTGGDTGYVTMWMKGKSHYLNLSHTFRPPFRPR